MLLPDFVSLTEADQKTLLKAGILEMCLLKSALNFEYPNYYKRSFNNKNIFDELYKHWVFSEQYLFPVM